MNPNQLRFAVSDRINDSEVSPSHVSLALLGEFQKDVSEFLKGSTNDVELSKVIVSIEQGSLALRASELRSTNTLWSDLEHLNSTDSLSLIDLKRAKVIERWQSSARKNPHRRYSVVDESARISFSIDSTSEYHRMEDMWVSVEKYLYGEVVDIGGTTKPNVHLKLENGATLTIPATRNLLEKGEQNRLYRAALLHVTAEENLITGELRNYQLLEFADYQPSYDETKFNLMVERGTKAWADVSDATEWLEALRGNKA